MRTSRSPSRLRRLVLPLAVAVLLAALGAPPARAAICATDAVPGATLLLPYFEVDLDHPNGLTTLFSIDNASATAVLAHVVVWSDLAVPVVNFNLYLTGYDVQSLNLRDLLVGGGLPQTASWGQDPGDAISPKGQYSQDINFATCTGKLPPPPMTADQLAHLQSALTGRPSPLAGGMCLGRNLGDRIARGYVTVDTVNNCTLRIPGDPGYIGDGPPFSGDLTGQNVLWGTWYIVNSAHDFAQGSNLVAIEASAGYPAAATAGRYTFYGRYDGWNGADHREPLATNFALQYAVGSTFHGAADVIVWRDPKVAQEPFACPAASGGPAWYPLGQQGIALYDEEEHVELGSPNFDPPPPPPVPFAAAAQRVRLGDGELPLSFAFGWIELDLNRPASGPNPASDPTASQAWVMSVQSSDGRFATAVDAFRLDSACAVHHPIF